jgi:hypothetical protein
MEGSDHVIVCVLLQNLAGVTEKTTLDLSQDN